LDIPKAVDTDSELFTITFEHPDHNLTHYSADSGQNTCEYENEDVLTLAELLGLEPSEANRFHKLMDLYPKLGITDYSTMPDEEI